MLIKMLRDRLTAIAAELRAIDDLAVAEKRTALTPDEETKYATLRAERKQVQERLDGALEDEEARTKLGDAQQRGGAPVDSDGQPRFTITREAKIYDRHQRNSYLLDIARYQLGRNREEAEGRLIRHAQELDVDLPAREAKRQARADDSLSRVNPASFFERSTGAPGAADMRANPSRIDGQGGYFVPPLWLVDEFIAALRNGRPFMNAVRQIELPSGTDSINIPKVNTGTTVSPQVDGGQVSSTDLTDTFVTAPVRTIAGQQDIAMQLLDQSPVAFDEIVFADLLADYAYKVDQQGFIGTGVNGQLKGLDSVSGVNAVTFTSGSPTMVLLYPILGQAQSQLAKNRKRADGIQWFMQAPRWYWAATSLDGSNRPFVVPTDQGPFNAMASTDGTPVAQGPVGRILGAPANLDMSITTTDGGGTNQDRIYAVRTDDLYLFEGAMRTRAMTEVLSGTLQVRLQVYNYVAFMPDRYPSSISIISGTGLVSPSGF